MSAAAAEVTFEVQPEPRWPEMRRVCCACGCGRWWYWERSAHRPPAYATPDCWRRARNWRKRGGRAARSPVRDRLGRFVKGA